MEVPFSPIDARASKVITKTPSAERRGVDPLVQQLNKLDRAKTQTYELTTADVAELKRLSGLYEAERKAAAGIVRAAGNGPQPAEELEEFLGGPALTQAVDTYFSGAHFSGGRPDTGKKMMLEYYIQQGAARKQLREVTNDGHDIGALPPDWQANLVYLQVHPDFPEPEATGFRWSGGRGAPGPDLGGSGTRGGGPAGDDERPKTELLNTGGEMLAQQPKDMLQLAKWVRGYITQLIFESRTKNSPASMETSVRNYLKGLGQSRETLDLVEKFVDEAGAVQRMEDLGIFFKNEGGTNDGLKAIGKGVTGGEYEISVFRLEKLKDWQPTPIPEYLQRAYGGRTEVSMSEVNDRALTVYVGFLGEWADACGAIWRECIREEDLNMRKRNLHRQSPQEWGRHVKDKYRDVRNVFEKTTRDTFGLMPIEQKYAAGLKGIEAKYADILHLPTAADGTIDGTFLKNALESKLPKYEAKLGNPGERDPRRMNDFQKAFDAIRSGTNIRFSELFGKKNIFDDSLTDIGKKWTREVIAGLCGGEDYSAYLALNMVGGTGEAAQLNTTEESGGYDSGAMTHLINFEARQITEAITGATVGSEHTIGRFKNLGKSLLRNTVIDKKNIVQTIRDGGRFSEIPWSRLGAEPGFGWGTLMLNRSIPAYEAILGAPVADFARDLNPEKLKGLIKPFNTAFAGFGGTELRFTGDDITDKESQEEMWKRRQMWAGKHLDPSKREAKSAKVKDLGELGADEWSPWFAWALGTIMAHVPDQGMLPPELWPSAGIVPSPARREVVQTWSHRGPVYEYGGAGVQTTEKPLVQNSIPAFMESLLVTRLLTPGEVHLLGAVLREVRVGGKPNGPKLNFQYEPSR